MEIAKDQAAKMPTEDQMAVMMKQYDQGVRMECVRQAVAAKPESVLGLAKELYDFVMAKR